ncbi:PLP-dependent aminotransferase family protein [Lysinibacillus sp. FSL K6-0232]|uniref:aminotransferase-like domain-containing protein n=1 Tax=Lysinibacillus sp. FSL K6-0232 TaxID=2921425 RepID=UPI0030FA92F9
MQTKYLEIIKDIKAQLTKGILTTGSKLPSVRQLSQQFSCSKNTVLRAYNELEKEHIIFSVPKSGYYVVHQATQPSAPQQIIDFLSAGPDKRIMPYIEFQHCMNQAIDIYKEELFSYNDQQGLYALRVQLAKYLQNLQVFTSPERLFIVSGSQQALHLLASMPFPNGKHNILVEQPTYFGFIEAVRLQQVTTLGIDLTMEGIDLEQLEYIFRNNDIKFFYIVPRFQNPLGHSYTNEEKKRIVELAEKYDVYIVEDDFLGDLDPNMKADPLFSFNPSGRVIYIKSFSKVFLPGLRVGAVVLPALMIHDFSRYKFSADFNSSVLSQGALDIYLKSGMFDSHIKTIKELYSRKMNALQTACEALLPNHIHFTKPTSGFYLSIMLPDHISAKQVVHLLHEKNIWMDDASRMFLPAYQQDHLIRLSISQVEEHLIEEGINELAYCLSLLERNKSRYKNMRPLL